MSLLDTLKAKLDPELFAQVTDALGDDFDYDLVTRSRLNAVIGQREAAKRAAQRQQQTQVEIPGGAGSGTAWNVEGENPMDLFNRFMQQMWAMQNPQGPTGPIGDPGVSAADVLPGQQRAPAPADVQKQIDAEVQKQVNQVKQQYAITEKLRVAGAVDPALILNGGLLDQSQLKWSADDPTKLEGGFDEQLVSLKEQRAYLFQQNPQNSGVAGTGREGNPGSIGAISSLKDFTALPYDQQIAFKQQHPEAVQGFMAQAGFAGLIGGPDN